MPWAHRELLFDPAELRRLFPERIVAWMEAHPPDPGEGRDGERRRQRLEALAPLRPFPAPDELPVVVAARMSLSFPLLISAVPLRALDMTRTRTRNAVEAVEEGRAPAHPLDAEVCWFADGGIASNFPVHFFDTPLPTRPTFAIDLDGFHPDHGRKPDEAKNVYLPSSNAGGLLDTWHRLDPKPGLASLVGFASGIVRTMQNHVDATLTHQPGYRDRIVHVHTAPDEGGMNLTMPADVIDALTRRGQAAGRALVERFAETPGTESGLSWDNHRWVRYRSALAALAEQARGIRRRVASATSAASARTESSSSAASPTAPPATGSRRRRSASSLSPSPICSPRLGDRAERGPGGCRHGSSAPGAGLAHRPERLALDAGGLERPPDRRERLLHRVFGTAYPSSEPRRCANTVPTTCPSLSTIGPPEFPLRTSPRSARIGRASWSRPYASRAPSDVVPPRRTGVTRYGPFPGKPSSAPGSPRSGSASRSARPARPRTRSTATSFRASNATTVACFPRLSRRSTTGESTPATTCAFVTTSPGRTIQPGALDAEPARDAADADDGAAGRPHLRVAGDRRLGRRHAGGRPDERRERVDAPHGVHHALGRHGIGQRRDDRGLLREPPKLALTRDVEEHGADRPADREPDRGARARPRPPSRAPSAAAPW